jgi:hypothetical protein
VLLMAMNHRITHYQTSPRCVCLPDLPCGLKSTGYITMMMMACVAIARLAACCCAPSDSRPCGQAVMRLMSSNHWRSTQPAPPLPGSVTCLHTLKNSLFPYFSLHAGCHATSDQTLENSLLNPSQHSSC